MLVPIKFNIYKKIYDYLPENALAEKIIKIRKCNNLDRIEFGEAIGHYWSSVRQWELNEIYPKLNTIKDICDTFNVDLKYFGDYYYWVFNNPGKKFKELGVFEELKKKKAINYDDVPKKFKAWKEKMSSSNLECAEILNVSVPTIKRLLKGKTKFIELYERLKELKII